MKNKVVLGIDTSNYKTSLALTGGDEIICDIRSFLTVRPGEKGLRQSEALFQHVKNLPVLMKEMREIYDGPIDGIACSDRPRPVDGSYMPCFLAGLELGKSLAAAMKIPVVTFSHQEGHIEAVRRGTPVSDGEEFLACHFSGGTTELLRVKTASAYDPEVVGGTRDIALGQVLDRAGVAMGYDFPCGEEMDRYALETGVTTHVLTAIKVRNGEINLSGIDTQIKKFIPELGRSLTGEIFMKLAEAVSAMIVQACDRTSIRRVIMSGGVASSRFIRRETAEKLAENNIEVYFDERGLSSDNAVGIAYLGGRFLWE